MRGSRGEAWGNGHYSPIFICTGNAIRSGQVLMMSQGEIFDVTHNEGSFLGVRYICLVNYYSRNERCPPAVWWGCAKYSQELELERRGPANEVAGLGLSSEWGGGGWGVVARFGEIGTEAGEWGLGPWVWRQRSICPKPWGLSHLELRRAGMGR